MGTAQRASGIQVESFTGLHWIGILAAVVSGVVHLFLGYQGFVGSYISRNLGIAFLLAGLGFLGAVALVLLDVRRRAVYAVGIPFTAVQTVLWYYLNFAAAQRSFPGDVGPIGAVDKLAQLLLIVVLVALLRRD
jgi:hypothetical protein